MTATNYLKQQCLEALLGGATLEAGLLDTSTSYTFDATTDQFVADLPTSSAEPGDASYSRVTLSNVTITQDDTDNEGVLDADDIVFPSLTTANDIQTAFVYRQSDGLLVAVYDDSTVADFPETTTGDDFTITLDAEGLTNIS